MSTDLRNIILVCFLMTFHFIGRSQTLGNIDSLKYQVSIQTDDSNKVRSLYTLSFAFVAGSYADSGLTYAKQALDLAERIKYESGIFWSQVAVGGALAILGNYPLALEYDFKTLSLGKKINQTLFVCYGNGSLAECYFYMGDYHSSIQYAQEVLKIINSPDKYWMWIQLARDYQGLNQFDSAQYFGQKAYEIIRTLNFPYAKSVISTVMGNAYFGMGQYDSALYFFRTGIPLSIQSNTPAHMVDDYFGVAEVYRRKGQFDSAKAYCMMILREKIMKAYPAGLLKTAELLSEIYYSMGKSDSALKYYKEAVAVKDSLSNRDKTIAVQNLIHREMEKEKEIQILQADFQRRLRLYVLSILAILLAISGILILRNHRRKQVQHMRNSIADDLHDDIGSALSSITIMSELAKKKMTQAPALLTSITESSISMQENMSDIVWSIRSENDSFKSVMERMRGFAAEILNAKDIELHFDCDPSLLSVSMIMKQRKNLYLIFKEAINNAAKYSGAKNVKVHINKEENQFKMDIYDDGHGFDIKNNVRGNGMLSMKKRADDLNGFFHIKTEYNKGTMVQLRFKIT